MSGGGGGEEEGGGGAALALKALFDLLHFVCLGCSVEQSEELTALFKASTKSCFIIRRYRIAIKTDDFIHNGSTHYILGVFLNYW